MAARFDLTTRRRQVWQPRAAISDSPCASNLVPTPCLRCSLSTHRSSTHSWFVIITPENLRVRYCYPCQWPVLVFELQGDRIGSEKVLKRLSRYYLYEISH